jgi:Transposase and inactivated derivatives
MNSESLAHTRWACKYHVVFIPKWRRRVLFGQVRRHLGRVFREFGVNEFLDSFEEATCPAAFSR